MVKAGRAGDTQVTDPVWYGGRKQVGADDADGAAAIEAGPSDADVAPEQQTGGAGARW